MLPRLVRASRLLPAVAGALCLLLVAGVAAAEPSARLGAAVRGLPLMFEENRGQADPSVAYLARGGGYALLLRQGDVRYHLRQPGANGAEAAVTMTFAGGAAQPVLAAGERLPGTTSYFRGGRPDAWRTGVPQFGQVCYHQVWPGIDIVFHGQQGLLKFDALLAPGADPQQVRLRFDGARSLRIDRHGDLVLAVPGGELRKPRPVLYQDGPRGRELVRGRYALLGEGQVGFRVGRYDRARPLVIDPSVSFASYLGGSADDLLSAVATDSSGNVYVAGATASTSLTPTSPIQGAKQAGTDVLLAKLNSNLTGAAYVAMLGGAGDEGAAFVAVDAAGNAYVAGGTTSADFPTQGGPRAAFVTGSTNFFISKVNADASALTFSGYWGPTTGGQTATLSGMAIDGLGNVYLCGSTPDSTFPTQNPLQAAAGSSDVWLTKLTADGSGVVYSTFLGGQANDYARALAVDSSGNAYLAGTTGSSNFPLSSAVQAQLSGTSDAFLAIVSSAPALSYSTYLGGRNDEDSGALVLGRDRSIYVAGSTNSPDFPVAGAPLETTGSSFLARFAPGAASLPYATCLSSATLGSGGFGSGLVTDPAGNLYLLGTRAGSPTTAIVTELAAQGTTFGFQYSFGGSADTTLAGGAWQNGALAVVGATLATDLPAVTSAYQKTNRGQRDGYAALVVGDPFQQPDLSIRQLGAASFVGANLYNLDGTSQTVSASTAANVAAAYQMRLQNNGNVADSIRITGPTSGTNWTLHYFDAATGGTDITSQVTGGGYVVTGLAAGATVDLRAEVTPSAAVTVDTSLDVLVTATSITNNAKRDVVKAVTTRTTGPRLDFWQTQTGYASDGVEPNSGTRTTTFAFRALYTNVLGTPATAVLLHLLRDGADITGSPFNMTVQTGSDPRVGVVYGHDVSGLVKGGTYTYFVTGSDGTNTATGPLTSVHTGPSVLNSPPTVSAVDIQPSSPLVTQDLTVSYAFNDPDGDTESGTSITWLKNAVPVTGLADPKVLPAGRLTMGATITVVVTPSDGTNTGTSAAGPQRVVETRKLAINTGPTVGTQGLAVHVTATLTNGADVPVAGEAVTFTSPTATITGGTVNTDASGRAGVDVLPAVGSNQVNLSSGGAFASLTILGRAPGSTLMAVDPGVVVADQQTDVKVTVTDKTSGQAVSGMYVTSALISGTATPTTAAAVTNPSGQVTLSHTFSFGTTQMKFAAGDAGQSLNIVAVAGSIVRDKSSVALADDKVPGDGTATVGITVTMKDTNGHPVVGLPGSAFSITGTPDVGLTFKMNTSDANGVARGTLSGNKPGTATLLVKVTDPINGKLTTLNDTLQVRVLGVFVMRLQPGLNLVGTPFTLPDAGPLKVWSALSPIEVARYDSATGVYGKLNVLAPAATFDVTPGRAFWVHTKTATNITLSGDAVSTSTYTLALDTGTWTLGSVPTTAALAWDTSVIQATINGLAVGSLSANTDVVAPYAWLWNPSRQQYELLVDASLGLSGTVSLIPAGAGLWLHRGTGTNSRTGLQFDLQKLTRGRARPEAPAGPGQWALQLDVAADGVPGSSTTVGVSTRLPQRLEIERPPAAADGLTIDVIEPVGGRAMAGCLENAPLGNTAREYRLRVTAPAGAGPLTLSWAGAGRSLPAGYRATVTDLTTGRCVSLRSKTSLALGEATSRELVLRLERQSSDRLAVTLQGAPTGRSRAATLSVTVSQAATLRLRVLGLSGRVIREWSVGDVAAGTTPVRWDGLDGDGRRVPAGTYRLEAWVEGAEGDQAVASTIITVR